MNIESCPTGFLEENCYLVSNPSTRETVVVDPGDDAPSLAARLDAMDAVVVAYLLTHGHVDHVSALAALAQTRPAPVFVHPLDADWCFTRVNFLPGLYDAPAAPPSALRHVGESSVLELAGARWSVIETPGHTPGGVCFRLDPDGALFSGDTLFRGSAGRTDLRGGDPRALALSLRKLAALPEDLRVFPGHGDPTTIGHEKRHNFFLRS